MHANVFPPSLLIPYPCLYIHAYIRARDLRAVSFEPENFDSITFVSIYNIHTCIYIYNSSRKFAMSEKLVEFLIKNASK